MTMGKKKRQADHNVSNNSSDSNDENEAKSNSSSCVHVSKAIVQGAFRKWLREDSWPPECFDCKRLSKDALVNGHGGDGEEEHIFVCLRCGQARCGGEKDHAQKHSRNTQSEAHDVALNTDSMTVWCFKCNSEIPPNTPKKLSDAIEFLKTRSSKISKEKGEKSGWSEAAPAADAATTYTGSFVFASLPINNVAAPGLPRLRGLANLGNTCFMNATLQCLAQTPFLLPVLEEMKEAGEAFALPGGDVRIGESTAKLEPLKGTLREWGPLTAALAETLRELQTGRSDTFVPNRLRAQLHDKCPQFRGFAEHDAHELLRQLLDTVRIEDLQRYQQGILEELKLDSKSERRDMSDEMRLTVKGYGRQAGDLHLRPSRVFRGELVSTLVCQRCRHATDHIEHFLDLSLPVAADKPVHVRRKQSEDAEGLSKHQVKEQKAAARRRARQAHKSNVAGPSPESEATSKGSADDSDADAEDEAEPNTTSEDSLFIGPRAGPEASKQPNTTSEDSLFIGPRAGPEASKQPNTTSEDSLFIGPRPGPSKQPTLELNGKDVTLAPDECTPLIPDGDPAQDGSLRPGGRTDLPEEEEEALPEQRDVLESGYSSEKPGTGDSVCGSPSSERPTLDTLPSDMSGLQVCTDLGACGSAVAEDSSCSEDADLAAGATLAPRAYTSSSECTLVTCLNQFTAQELLTGNNKVGCDACTERTNGKGGKTVYTDASKQLLIVSPPAILILHLKRFQVLRFTSRKNSEEVKFPLVLDLAPFCSAKSRSRPNPSVRRDQREVRYALYGVVQHSGNMHGGHYVAYVKVRPSLPPDSPRWGFLPGGTPPQDPCGPPDPPPGQWYYVSDSHVNESREARVLDSEAYVLFYERIW